MRQRQEGDRDKIETNKSETEIRVGQRQEVTLSRMRQRQEGDRDKSETNKSETETRERQ